VAQPIIPRALERPVRGGPWWSALPAGSCRQRCWGATRWRRGLQLPRLTAGETLQVSV